VHVADQIITDNFRLLHDHRCVVQLSAEVCGCLFWSAAAKRLYTASNPPQNEWVAAVLAHGRNWL
jgi:hypothetical protein